MIDGMLEASFIGCMLPLLFLAFSVKGESRRLILFFIWGLTAALAAYYINTIIDHYSTMNDRLLVTLVVPAVEEILKIIPVFFLLNPKIKGTGYSIARMAFSIGTGFAVFENLFYLSLFNDADGWKALIFMLSRSITACLLHGSTTALTGYILQFIKRSGVKAIMLIPGSLLFTFIIHSAFNMAATSTWGRFISMVIPVLLLLVQIFVLNLFGFSSTRRIFERGRALSPEVSNGAK